MSGIARPQSWKRSSFDEATDRWLDVGAAADVPLDQGIAVLVEPAGEAHGEDGVKSSESGLRSASTSVPVALFRLSATVDAAQEQWFAVSHIDPVTGAPVMARGLVGSVTVGTDDVPTIASPMHKQRYDLRTGRCLDDDKLRLEPVEVRVTDGRVLLRQIDGRSHPGHVDETLR